MYKKTEPACAIKECRFHKHLTEFDRDSFIALNDKGEFAEEERIDRLRFAKNGVIYTICSLHAALPEEEIKKLLP